MSPYLQATTVTVPFDRPSIEGSVTYAERYALNLTRRQDGRTRVTQEMNARDGTLTELAWASFIASQGAVINPPVAFHEDGRVVRMDGVWAYDTKCKGVDARTFTASKSELTKWDTPILYVAFTLWDANTLLLRGSAWGCNDVLAHDADVIRPLWIASTEAPGSMYFRTERLGDHLFTMSAKDTIDFFIDRITP